MMWQCHLSAQDYRYYPVDGYSLLKRFPLHPLSGPRCPVQTVGQWLESIGLPQYENHLMANGFDNVQFMVRRALCVHRACLLSVFASHVSNTARRQPDAHRNQPVRFRSVKASGKGMPSGLNLTVCIETLAEK